MCSVPGPRPGHCPERVGTPPSPRHTAIWGKAARHRLTNGGGRGHTATPGAPSTATRAVVERGVRGATSSSVPPARDPAWVKAAVARPKQAATCSAGSRLSTASSPRHTPAPHACPVPASPASPPGPGAPAGQGLVATWPCPCLPCCRGGRGLRAATGRQCWYQPGSNGTSADRRRAQRLAPTGARGWVLSPQRLMPQEPATASQDGGPRRLPVRCPALRPLGPAPGRGRGGLG